MQSVKRKQRCNKGEWTAHHCPHPRTDCSGIAKKISTWRDKHRGTTSTQLSFCFSSSCHSQQLFTKTKIHPPRGGVDSGADSVACGEWHEPQEWTRGMLTHPVLNRCRERFGRAAGGGGGGATLSASPRASTIKHETRQGQWREEMSTVFDSTWLFGCAHDTEEQPRCKLVQLLLHHIQQNKGRGERGVQRKVDHVLEPYGW